MTADIVNLSKVRKARERALWEREAHENRLKHGQPKSERNLTQAERRKLQAELDGARREGGQVIDGTDDFDPSTAS
jgi:hypothetical protein